MSRLRLLYLTSLLALALLALAPSANAQEPQCPAGYHWDRLSGVGCVQTNCFDVANAYWSYTGQCICAEGFKACTEAVDSSGVDCGPFCPLSRLVACIDPAAACPGAPSPGFGEDGQPGGGGAFGRPAETPGDTGRSADDGIPGVELPDLGTLVRDLNAFLAGEGVTSPTPGQAAATGAALATLLATWVLLQAISGAPAADALRAVSQWRAGQSPSAANEKARQMTAETDPRPPPAAGPIADAGVAAQTAPTLSTVQAGMIPGPAAHAVQPIPWGGKTQHFEMRVVDSLEVGGFGAGMKTEIEIRASYKDAAGRLQKSAPVRYRFVGFGVTLGLTARSGSMGGGWETFRTINPVSLDAFEGFGTYKNKGTFAFGAGSVGPTEYWFQNTTTRAKPKSKFTWGFGASYWSAYAGKWTRL